MQLVTQGRKVANVCAKGRDLCLRVRKLCQRLCQVRLLVVEAVLDGRLLLLKDCELLRSGANLGLKVRQLGLIRPRHSELRLDGPELSLNCAELLQDSEPLIYRQLSRRLGRSEAVCEALPRSAGQWRGMPAVPQDRRCFLQPSLFGLGIRSGRLPPLVQPLQGAGRIRAASLQARLVGLRAGSRVEGRVALSLCRLQ